MTAYELHEQYSVSEIEHFIDEFIFSERDRAILKRRILDGVLYEQLSREFDLEPDYISKLVRKNILKLNDRIKRYEKRQAKKS